MGGWTSRFFVLALIEVGCTSPPPTTTRSDAGAATDIASDRTANDTAPTRGRRLAGAPASNAWAAMTDVAPTTVPEAEIFGQWITTRLIAVVAPAATVGEVNAALDRTGAEIDCMSRGGFVMTLAVPPMADLSALRDRVSGLTRGGAFAFAFPDSVATTSLHPWLPGNAPATDHGLEHLRAARMPAAWNVAALARSRRRPVTVIVPDFYYQSTRHAEIRAQSFPAGGRDLDRTSTDAGYRGNHGFFVSGIIAGDWDPMGITGTNPAPQDLLDLRSYSIGGVGQHALGSLIEEWLPAGPSVLNTSLGWASFEVRLPGGTVTSVATDRIALATLALDWRRRFGRRQNFLHVAAAGNEYGADARVQAPWALAASFADVAEAVPQPERLVFVPVRDAALALDPRLGTRMTNTILVGAMNGNARALFSNAHSDVEAQGVGLLGACVAPDCPTGRARGSGTSYSAPLVAGLAAWLWNLAPSLDVTQLRQLVVGTARSAGEPPGIVDGYNAVLAIDGLTGSRGEVRKTLFDVVGPLGPVPDGRFDEHDIAAFLAAMPDALPSSRDDSRFDLNGSGVTTRAGSDVEFFDLDMDSVLRADVTLASPRLNRTYNEMGTTDLEVLCYYAYGALFEGDTTVRNQMLDALCGITVTVSPASVTLTPGTSAAFRARLTNVRRDTSVTWTASGGTIARDGSYTAPTALGTYTITATSVEDSSRRGTATVTVAASLNGSVGYTVMCRTSGHVPAHMGVDTVRNTSGTIAISGRVGSPVVTLGPSPSLFLPEACTGSLSLDAGDYRGGQYECALGTGCTGTAFRWTWGATTLSGSGDVACTVADGRPPYPSSHWATTCTGTRTAP